MRGQNGGLRRSEAEVAEDGGQLLGKVFGDQAGAEGQRAFDMEPGGGFGRLHGRETTGEKAGDEARQNVARACGGKPWRGAIVLGGVDGAAARGVGDHRVGAFVKDDAARAGGGLTGGIDLGISWAFGGGFRQLFRDVGEKAGELPGMRGEDAVFMERGEEVGFAGEDRQGVGVEDGSDLIACLNWALWHGQELSDDDLRAWQAARREQLGLAPRA